MTTRRVFKNKRKENPLAEMERNGYEILTRGWPIAIALKEGDKPIAVFLRRHTKHLKHEDSGFSKKKLRMVDFFKEIGVRVVKL